LLLTLAAPHAALADVPGRVGRIAFMEGDVQSYSESDPEWKVAYPNEPITSRNSIFVGDAGRAEISVGSTTLAMDAGSQVDIQQLDDNTFNANVIRGRVSVRVRRLDPNDVYNVAVPGADFALLQPGRYRIDALDGASGLTVFSGQASVQGDREPMPVQAGNAVRVVANAQDPNSPPQIIAAAPVPVPLDDWVVAREQRFRDNQAQRYVSPNMTGYEDLDANGRWSNEPDVGPVWYPTTYVRADWAPYRYGRWAYVAPWGYTWIDDAPWGFAPFHYGRWLQVGNRWGWVPGAYVARPVFAPALVGFYGGAGFTASFSVGVGPAIGWYPLAPWERFAPHYAHSTGYINQVNNIVVVNAPARFAREGGNRERGGTLVPQDAFASQRSISRVAIVAPRNAFERTAPFNAAELPRPATVPGAVRRGPDVAGGVTRPEFRSPREFATRPGIRDGRAIEAGRPQPGNVGAAPDQQRSVERSTLPPNYRRMPEAARPSVNAETQRPGQPNPNANLDAERAAQQQRGPNAPNFSREGRPVAQPVAPTAENPNPAAANGQRFTPRVQQVAPAAAENPNPAAANGQRFTPRVQEVAPAAAETPNPASPNAQRFGQRQQAMQRGDGEAIERARQEQAQQNQQRNAERPNREFRAPQPPQNVQPQNVQPQAPRPQAAERPQAVERPQRVERPAPVAPVAPVAPQAPRPQPQRVEPVAGPGAPAERGGPGRERER
jgi:hypothetical protein